MSGFSESKRASGDPVMTVDDLLEKTSRDHGGGPVEYFHRCSRSVRVEWDRATDRVAARCGTEEGGALRWLDPRRESGGFVAASGDVVASLTACRAIGRGAPETSIGAVPWNPSAEATEDLDTPHGVPRIEELEHWLRENTPETVESAWIEASRSRERWTTGSADQERVRVRIWALWTPKNDPKPMFLAARSWRDWLRQDALATWDERAPGPPREAEWPADAKVVFSPETSASIARALVLALHRPGVEAGAPVGSGWVVRSNGEPPRGLFGALVDDAGYPVSPRILADGRHVVADWGGPGSFRRGSFRDPPASNPVCVEVDPPRIDPPRRSVWVTALALHPAADGWLAELHGREFPDGSSFRPRWARLRPQRLIESCLGGLGSARTSHHGLGTPALVFDAWLFDD